MVAQLLAPDMRAGLIDGLPMVRAFIARQVPPGDVDDVLQDVALRLQLCASRDPIDNGGGYLFQVARSVVFDRRRRDATRLRARHETLSDQHHPADPLSPARVAEGREQLARAMAALQALPERTRQIFMLHRFERMRYAEIAAQLNISVSAVEKHIMKAVRQLVEACAD